MWDDEEKIEPKRAQDEPVSPQRHLLGEHRRREVFPGSSQMEVASAVAEKPSPCSHAIISATESTATSPCAGREVVRKVFPASIVRRVTSR